mgnify:CR=1 FL=1
MKRIYIFLALTGFALMSCDSDVEWYGVVERGEQNTNSIHQIEHKDEKVNLPSIENPVIKKRNEVILIKSSTNRLRIIFGFNKELMFTIKKIPYHSWDGKNKWWSIPYSVHFQNLIESKIIEYSEGQFDMDTFLEQNKKLIELIK